MILTAPNRDITANPVLAQSCGLDIVLVMDSSGSIQGSDDPNPDPFGTPPLSQFEQMQKALIDFVDTFLPATPKQFAFVEFNTQAMQRTIAGSTFSGEAGDVTAEIAGPREVNTPVDGLDPVFTNYDDALKVARDALADPANRTGRPDLIVFASDGVPTVLGHPGAVDSAEGGAPDAAANSTWIIELEAGVDEANLAKAAGTRILTFGIALDPTFGAAAFALENISSADAVTTAGFDELGAELSQLAIDLCGGTVTVNKLIDADGDASTTNDRTPADSTTPFDFTISSSAGVPNDTQLTTGDDGAVVFEVDSLGGQTADVTITEGVLPTSTLISAFCTRDGAENGTWDVATNSVGSIELGAQDIVTCTFVNGPAPVQTGTLIVRKDFVDATLFAPADPEVQVTLSPEGSSPTFLLSDPDPGVGGGDETGAQTYAADTVVTVSEVGTNLDLSGYNAELDCGAGAIGTTSGQVTIQANIETTCTFTNTRPTADLQLAKVADDSSAWQILVNGVPVAATFVNGTQVDVIVPSNLQLTVSETGDTGVVDDNYDTSVSCTGDHDVGSLTKTVVVPGLSTDPAPNDGVDEICTFTNTLKPRIDLSIDKTDVLDPVSRGDTITYSLAYKNNSNVAVSGVTLTETVPAETVHAGGDGISGGASWVCNGTGAGEGCTLSIGDLAVGEMGTATFKVTVLANTTATRIDNLASIKDDETQGADANSLDNSSSEATILRAPATGTITVVKHFDDNTDIIALRAHETATATLFVDQQSQQVTGDGSFGPLTFTVGAIVNVDETIGDPTQWEKTGFSCVDGLNIIVDPIGGGGTATGYDIQIIAGDITRTFTNTRLTATLHVLKTVENDDGSAYQIKINGHDVGAPIGNNGEVVAVVPANTALTVSEPDTAESTTHSCEFGGISGAGTSFGPFQMEPGVDQDCEFTNTLAVITAPSIDISKQAEGPDSRTFDSGSDVTFEIRVENDGDVDLVDVSVSDALTPACDNVIGALAAGDSVTYTCEATNVTAGFVNVASATGTESRTSNQVSDSDESTVVLRVLIDITVTKVVVNNDGSAPEQGTEFSIEVFCTADSIFEFLTLVNGESDTVSGITAGTSCEIFEVFGEGFPVPSEIFGEVERPFNVSETITITNVYGDAPVVVQSAAPPPPITVTVTKAVTTSGLGQAPDAGTQFGFRLECLGPDFDFTLADGQSFTASIATNTLCSLSETDSQGATEVSGAFGDTLLTANSSFTVTNNYHEDEPVVAGTNITKTLTSADPAAVGEPVVFEVAVTFEGSVLPNTELIDVYDRAFIEFVSASVEGVPLSCDVFDSGANGMVACTLGDASGPFTVQLTYVAVQATVPDRTLDSAEVRFDLDGPGGDPSQTIGPVDADIEIIEVLALPPLGDGADASRTAGGALALLGAAIVAAAGARRLARQRSGRRGRDIAA